MNTVRQYDPRRSKLAIIHIAKKKLKLPDEYYRALLYGATGKESAAQMSLAECEKVIAEFEALGFKTNGGRKKAMHPQAKKARALWRELHRLGAVRNPSEQALAVFGKRQTGIEDLNWIRDPKQCAQIIEALKFWIKRHLATKKP